MVGATVKACKARAVAVAWARAMAADAKAVGALMGAARWAAVAPEARVGLATVLVVAATVKVSKEADTTVGAKAGVATLEAEGTALGSKAAAEAAEAARAATGATPPQVWRAAAVTAPAKPVMEEAVGTARARVVGPTAVG